mgnify:FL=1
MEKMGSDQNNNTGCLFPFGDDFLPILMFFIHVNQPNPGASIFEEEDEDDQDPSEDEDEE